MSLIKQNPFFGDAFVYLQMEQLRQGQGIIDIVNGYLYTALFNGLVGLGLIVSVLLVALGRAAVATKRVRVIDADAEVELAVTGRPAEALGIGDDGGDERCHRVGVESGPGLVDGQAAFEVHMNIAGYGWPKC